MAPLLRTVKLSPYSELHVLQVEGSCAGRWPCEEYTVEFCGNQLVDNVLNSGKPKRRLVNRRFALFCLISAVVMLAACSGTPGAKSRFLTSFSARDVIEKSHSSPKGAADFRVSGGETSVLLGRRRTYHRDDRADVSISQSDESSFLQRIKEHIEQQLQINGCKITDAGSGEGHYSIAYTDGSVQGWIDIWGLRVMGDSYRLVITMTEN